MSDNTPSTGKGSLESRVFRDILDVVGVSLVFVCMITATLIWGLIHQQKAVVAESMPLASFRVALEMMEEYCVRHSFPDDLFYFGNIGWPSSETLVDPLVHRSPPNQFRPTHNALVEMGRVDYDALVETGSLDYNALVEMGIVEEDTVEGDTLVAGHVDYDALLEIMGRVDEEGEPLMGIMDFQKQSNFEFHQLLNISDNCEWTFGKRPPPSLLRMLGIFFGLSDQKPPDEAHDDLFLNKADEWGWSPDHLSLHAWRGTYHFTFTNPHVERTSAHPLHQRHPLAVPGWSIWIPVSDSRTFGQFVFAGIMVAWTMLVLVVGCGFVWWMIRPLRNFVRTAQNASRIILSRGDVSSKLETLATDLPSKRHDFRELKNLLHNMSGLLTERERSLGDFMHQLKNDILAVNNGINRLRESRGHVAESVPATSALDSIANPCRRMLDLLSNVTIYHSILYGKSKSEQPPKIKIDLDSILQSAANGVEDAGGRISFSGRKQLYVAGQRIELPSAIENLIWNAHYHGGAIEVTTRLGDDAERVEILIDDDGPGIDDDIDELIKPFRRGGKPDRKDSTYGRKYLGAGLGLTVAFEVIRDHGGEISISNRESTDGRREGLRVRVVLPLFQDT